MNSESENRTGNMEGGMGRYWLHLSPSYEMNKFREYGIQCDDYN